MKVEAPAIPDKIQEVEEGSHDTLLSAARANELIRAVNAFLRIEGRGQVKVVRSAENIVITSTTNEGK